MSREYIIIGIFLFFSLVIGFVNRPGSSPNFVWGVLYALYLVMSVVTTIIFVAKDVYGIKGFNEKDLERIFSNLLIIGIFLVAPWIAKILGTEGRKILRK